MTTTPAPFYGASLEQLIGDKPKKPKTHRSGFVQHYATPERQQRRRDMKLIGKRQYRKISFALKIRALDKERPKRVFPHNGPDGDPYTYITYPVEGADPFLSKINEQYMELLP